jgi:hypothetical protein
MRPEHSQAVDRDVHLHVEHVVTTAAPLLCRSDRPREVHECIVQRGGLRVRAEADQQAGHVPQGEPLLRPSPRSPVFQWSRTSRNMRAVMAGSPCTARMAAASSRRFLSTS